jgi:hypothetical protein
MAKNPISIPTERQNDDFAAALRGGLSTPPKPLKKHDSEAQEGATQKEAINLFYERA